MQQDANDENMFRAEKVVATVRILTFIAVVTVYVAFLRPRADTIKWLADISIGLATVYTLILVALRPYQKYSILSARFSAFVADNILITVGVLATGGIYSPLFVAYYAVNIAEGYRFGFWETMIGSGVSSISYLLVLTWTGALTEFPGDVIVRIGFIPLVAYLTGKLGSEAQRQKKQKIEQRDSALRLEREVKERQRAQTKLREAMAGLRRSNAELEQFAYMVSSDLQQPLNTMVNFAKSLERRFRGKMDAETDDAIYFIVEGGERMQAMIDNLLTYSRVGVRSGALEPLDSTEALEKAISNLEAAIFDNNAVISHDDLPVVMGDSAQIVRLLQHLIGNAITFRSEESPRVHVSAISQNGEWLFSVRDNSAGLDPQLAESIFEIIESPHGREEYRGTDIGLAICKKIVERHGGRIWAESTPGEGSTFYFTISAGESPPRAGKP